MEHINVTITTAELAEVLGADLAHFNAGRYSGTNIRYRQLTGLELVQIVGTTAGARVVSPESWIVDRFGSLNSRAAKRLVGSLPAI